MKKIKYLTIQFKNPIALRELPKFRGAVIECAGRENRLFHNHKEEGGFRYAYPLIQYKRLGQNAALVCLEEGVHEVHAFFQGRPQTLMLGDREIKPEVDWLNMREVTLQAWDKKFSYRISNWLALNPEAYADYNRMTDDEDRHRLLSTILRGNLLSLAKGLDWHVDREIKVKMTWVGSQRVMHYKDSKLSAFDARFETNVWLPTFLGLGKGSAMGYGLVQPMTKSNI